MSVSENRGVRAVPVQPTREMLEASAIAWTGQCHGYPPEEGHYRFMSALWAAMLEASPDFGMTEISPALAGRMAEVVRAVAEMPPLLAAENGWACDMRLGARAIVAELPKPVDPDLIEARKIAVGPFPGEESEFLSGEYDEGQFVQLALAGIRRGKELAPVNLGGGGI